MWILFTLLAAFSQAWRNAFQKQLSQHVDTYGVTLARFLLASPLAFIYLASLTTALQPEQLIPELHAKAWMYLLIACFCQILATALMVLLFQQRNYAIGVGLVKSEAMIAAVLGLWLFADPLSSLGWLGVFVGALAVWLLSGSLSLKRASIQSIAIGLLSGAAFAVTSLSVREASQTLSSPALLSAAWVLFLVLTLQSIFMLTALALWRPSTLKSMLSHKKLVFMISLAGCIGSIGWFTAFSLETVALVKTLGQLEVFFTLAIAVWVFKEKLVQRDKLGLLLIVISALLVVWSK
ncbi:MAG: DMT family transporter [Pseudomonadota bacterium]|nr:DMT family transporter [Pseudomonadota bacterium]